tara:strand:+ start:5753 stop:6694 length:942 start_codon:yes stop_codon:yes gene_type:complete
MPLISVIIPLYNKEQFIEATLISVLNQTFSDYEIIIINDGSTDKSLRNATKTLKGYNNHNLITQNNKGLSATRNVGISHAKGEIIALLDADDLWDRKYLEEIKELYLKYPEADLFGTDYIEKYTDLNVLEPTKNINLIKKNTTFLVNDFFKLNLYQPIITPSSFSFKKNIFRKVTFNEAIDFAEDVEFFIKSNISYRFAYSYKPLATVHFDIPNQMTQVGFKGKRLPNFDQFEVHTGQHTTLKKYLDTKRYYLSILCRISNDQQNLTLLRKQLNVSNLKIRQRILLNAPLVILKGLRSIKKHFLKKNIRLTSY